MLRNEEKILQLEGIPGNKKLSFVEEICHLDAAQTSTSLVVFTLKLHFRCRLYDCHIFDRKKDIYFLLHLPVILAPHRSEKPVPTHSAPLSFDSFKEHFISFYSISAIAPRFLFHKRNFCHSFSRLLFIGCYKLIFNEEKKIKQQKKVENSSAWRAAPMRHGTRVNIHCHGELERCVERMRCGVFEVTSVLPRGVKTIIIGIYVFYEGGRWLHETYRIAINEILTLHMRRSINTLNGAFIFVPDFSFHRFSLSS